MKLLASRLSHAAQCSTPWLVFAEISKISMCGLSLSTGCHDRGGVVHLQDLPHAVVTDAVRFSGFEEDAFSEQRIDHRFDFGCIDACFRGKLLNRSRRRGGENQSGFGLVKQLSEDARNDFGFPPGDLQLLREVYCFVLHRFFF